MMERSGAGVLLNIAHNNGGDAGTALSWQI